MCAALSTAAFHCSLSEESMGRDFKRSGRSSIGVIVGNRGGERNGIIDEGIARDEGRGAYLATVDVGDEGREVVRGEVVVIHHILPVYIL